MRIGRGIALGAQRAGGLPPVDVPTIDADATGALATVAAPTDEAWPAAQTYLDLSTGITWTLTPNAPATTAALTASSLSAYGPLLVGTSQSISLLFETVSGKTVRLRGEIAGVATLSLEWRAADMPAEGTTLVAGDTVIFRLGAEAVPFTVAAGTTVEFPASPTGERLVRFPAAMGQIVHADTAAGVRVGLVGTAPGEISAVRWQGGTPVASDAVDISGSASAFFKAAFLTNASAALGRLQDAAATDFDLSLNLSTVSGNVSSFALGGSLMRSPEGAIPFNGVGLETITARVTPDGAVTLVVSEANPATIILADVLDASSFAAMLANAPAASTPPTIDAAALATALGTPAVGAQTTVDLDAVTSGGAAPVSHTSNVGSVS